MACYYLKEYAVPIPYDKGNVVIRKEKKVEYELQRTYSAEDRSTRVKRKVIGEVDKFNPGMMFPSESYFELIADNPVPERIRDLFLEACRIKRTQAQVRRNPEEIARLAARGLAMLKTVTEQHAAPEETTEEIPEEKGAKNQMDSNEGYKRKIKNNSDFKVVGRVLEHVYYAIEVQATKNPNAVVDVYKVRLINEILEELKACYADKNLLPFLRLMEEPEEIEQEDGKKELKGLTYSDALLLLEWYKSIGDPFYF